MCQTLNMNTNLSNWAPTHRALAKNCPVCRAEILGRRDKKFCSLACKNRHHNHKNAPVRSHERQLSEVIIRNERILKRLFDGTEMKELTIPISILDMLGFDLKGPSMQGEDSSGRLWLGIGDFAFRHTDKEKRTLIIRTK